MVVLMLLMLRRDINEDERYNKNEMSPFFCSRTHVRALREVRIFLLFWTTVTRSILKFTLFTYFDLFRSIVITFNSRCFLKNGIYVVPLSLAGSDL